jgi:hypothetical protein
MCAIPKAGLFKESKVQEAMVFVSALWDTIHSALYDVSSFRPLCKSLFAKWTQVPGFKLVTYDTVFKPRHISRKCIRQVCPPKACRPVQTAHSEVWYWRPVPPFMTQQCMCSKLGNEVVTTLHESAITFLGTEGVCHITWVHKPISSSSSSSSYGSTTQFGRWPPLKGFRNNNLFTGLDC